MPEKTFWISGRRNLFLETIKHSFGNDLAKLLLGYGISFFVTHGLSPLFLNSAAELLTTNKLSELACLALYLMYEKKQGKESYWYPYIRELDRQRGRGQLAVESPLLWSRDELNEYFQGSNMKVIPTCARFNVSASFTFTRISAWHYSRQIQ